jgi:hypothetical protein
MLDIHVGLYSDLATLRFACFLVHEVIISVDKSQAVISEEDHVGWRKALDQTLLTATISSCEIPNFTVDGISYAIHKSERRFARTFTSEMRLVQPEVGRSKSMSCRADY